MKNKYFVIVVTLVMILSAITVPKNIDVTASGDFGDPDIDHEYIFDKTENLSKIVTWEDYKEYGRYFGTDGERYAADLIKNWMNNLRLDCVHNETINSWWFKWNENVRPKNSLYLGKLNKFRMMQDFYLNISIYNDSTLVEYKNLSWGECFPYHIRTLNPFKTSYEVNEKDIQITKNFDLISGVNQMELGYTHWTETYNVYNSVFDDRFPFQRLKALSKYYKGYIAIDNQIDAHVQFPPQRDHKFWETIFDKQGFYVNGSIGAWIVSNLDDYTVKATYYTKWEREDVTSYNVIGQINGTNTSKVNIVCAHYDAMCNQGTIDEAAETALVLGIAKYIKDHELESDLKYTVKFIAFAGEEEGMRGVKDYVKKHNIWTFCGGSAEENVSYVINPGNFGSYNRSGLNIHTGEEIIMDFELASDKL